MRPFRINDLLWLEKLAREQGQWENLLNGLTLSFCAWVVEGEAIGFIWNDRHGRVIGGLTKLPHIKSVVRLAYALVDTAVKTGINLHSHDVEGTLGNKLFRRMGFQQDGDALWLVAEQKENRECP